ncbi:hypothetical protein DY000_02050964 [Brassica cretica]|uniref:Uncharacterized protein n=1 Tax=Brassica cretica TaxID=69181 RepID=A0ABQ7ENB3_BRACR|nr:hypothetical protein DY000_02050964 [Brassica cretica]
MHSATTCICSSPYISHACCHLHRTFHDDATALACDYGIATSLPPHRALSDASNSQHPILKKMISSTYGNSLFKRHQALVLTLSFYTNALLPYFMMHPLSIASALEKHIYCKICIVPSMDIAMNYW